MIATSYPCTIAFDFKLMRPGCAIVQRTFNASIGNDQLHRFDSDLWLTSPTDGMKLVTLFSQDEMDRAVALTEEANA